MNHASGDAVDGCSGDGVRDSHQPLGAGDEGDHEGDQDGRDANSGTESKMADGVGDRICVDVRNGSGGGVHHPSEGVDAGVGGGIEKSIVNQASPMKRPRLNWESSRDDAPIAVEHKADVGPITTTLADAHGWAIQWLERQMRERDAPDSPYSNTLHDWVLSLNATTYSATFAGIDSPGTALLEWHYAVQKLVERETNANRSLPTKYVGPKTCWLLEWNDACQSELAIHPGTDKDTCRFGDMSALWKPTIQTLVQQVRNSKGGKVLDSLGDAVRSGCAVKDTAYCLTHKQQCRLCPCSLHIGGSPCTDNSNMGEKAGEEGKTMVDTLAWLAHIVACEHTVFVSENVPTEELVGTIKRLLGHMYHLEVVRDEANPCKLGWPVNRPRQFIVGIHKFKATGSMPLNTFVSSFARSCKMTWHDFLIADDATLNQEKAWAAARPVVMQRLEARGLLHDSQLWTFEDLLSDAEMEVLKAYRATCNSDCAWSLNQYPQNGRPRCSSPTTLHTIIRNVGFVWDETAHRWFTSTDLLVAQGFNLAGPPTCSFQIPSPGRKRQDVIAQIGNSMHVNAIGAVIAFALEIKHKTCSKFDRVFSESLMAARRNKRR